MSCGGFFGGSSFGGCGGGSDMRIPISSGSGCGGSRDYLYVTEHSSGCGGTSVSLTVDSGVCGGRVPASGRDVQRAFDNLRRYRHRGQQ